LHCKVLRKTFSDFNFFAVLIRSTHPTVVGTIVAPLKKGCYDHLQVSIRWLFVFGANSFWAKGNFVRGAK
jgi:hypothetical protein